MSLFTNSAGPGFLLDVVPGGPLDRGAESGVTQMVANQWNRWRQSPRTTAYVTRHGETGWPSAESGAPNMAPFGIVETGIGLPDAEILGPCDQCVDPPGPGETAWAYEPQCLKACVEAQGLSMAAWEACAPSCDYADPSWVYPPLMGREPPQHLNGDTGSWDKPAELGAVAVKALPGGPLIALGAIGALLYFAFTR